MSGTFEEEAAPTVEHGTSRQFRSTRLDPNGDSLCIDVDIEQKRVWSAFGGKQRREKDLYHFPFCLEQRYSTLNK